MGALLRRGQRAETQEEEVGVVPGARARDLRLLVIKQEVALNSVPAIS